MPAFSFHPSAGQGGTLISPELPLLAFSWYPLPLSSESTIAWAFSLVREHMVTSYPALAHAAHRWTPIRPVPPKNAIVGSAQVASAERTPKPGVVAAVALMMKKGRAVEVLVPAGALVGVAIGAARCAGTGY